MMIMKFNKMIRNKVVWWIIGGIVIITFVGWFSPRGGCDTGKAQTNQIGSLDGKPVTDAELRQARFNNYLGLCLTVGHVINITPRLDKELRAQSWKRIAALRAARELNITASPDEVLAVLKRDPQFQSEGVFNKQRYQMFCQNVLGTLNASVAQFEQQLAENIILQKLHNITASAVWLGPAELKRMASRYADSFRVDYITLGTNLVDAADVKVSEADMLAYYTQHTNEFLVPAKASVKYVEIPISTYLAKAVEKVDTNAIEDYYISHSDEFSTVDTNGAKVVTPIERVSKVISNTLLHTAATQLARDAGNELGDSLVPDREGSAPSFEAVAAKAKLTIHKTGLFDAETELPGIDAGLAFNAAAFRLRPTADESFSDAIAGSNHVYLMSLTTNTEAYIPEFTAVREKVRPLATAKASLDALFKKGQDLHNYFESGLAKKQSFATLARQKALNVSTSELFSANSAPDALSSSEILNDITVRNAGELSDVLPGTSGFMIAYVVERRPAGEEELSTIQNQVVMNVIRRRARIVFGDWENSLVSGNRKVDTQQTREQPEPTSDDE